MRILPILFSITLFCSAFLSFSVQPILGKMLLPMVGGAPAGWIVAMAFFQMALLAGYGVSYALERLSPWIHMIGLLALYAFGFIFLPPLLPQISDDLQGEQMSIAVVTALFQSIFVPFLALTATTSALQRVFAATSHPTASDPYYLFVASNAGSFVGLLCYPLVFEMLYGIHKQALLWQGLYAAAIALILLACGVAWIYRRRDAVAETVQQTAARTVVTSRDILLWLALSFIPCSLSMGVTTLITTDIAGVPLFWVVPLGLYLLTFVLAFARRQIASVEKLQFWHLMCVVMLIFNLVLGLTKLGGDMASFALAATTLLVIFFVIAWSCHRTLASLRPGADCLAMFYFIVALGGCLAGVMHAFILPFVLTNVVEFSVAVILSLVVHPEFWHPDLSPRLAKLKKFFYVCIVAALISAGFAYVIRVHEMDRMWQVPFLIIFGVTSFFITVQPRFLMALGLCIFAMSTFTHYKGHVVLTGRNFFGAHAVIEDKKEGFDVRYFAHGNTIHGLAVKNGTEEQKRNNSYYAQTGPIRDVIQTIGAKSVGIIGLGAGQLACFDRSLSVDFFEIDAEVVRIANEYFPYMKECPVRHVYIGDGRLELAKTDRVYDVMLLDAFTSDGIPLHILTREAVAMYRSHIGPDGMILFHVSNRYFDLTPPLAKIAQAEGLHAYRKTYQPDTKKNPLLLLSRWVAIPMTPGKGRELEKLGWSKAEPADLLWTDDYSTLLTAINTEIPKSFPQN